MESELFLNFIDKLSDKSNLTIIEAVDAAFSAIFEARTLPEVSPWKEGKFHWHEYKIAKDSPTSKIYRVVTRDSQKKLCVMLVQMFKLKPERLIGFVSDDVWVINFVKDGQSDFNVTGDGSLDVFNTVFSVIKHMIDDIKPEYIAYKPTDADEVKSAQKSRIYAGYFDRLGLSQVDNSTLPDTMNGLTVFKA